MKIRRKNKIISMIMVYVMLFTVFNLSGWNIITANAAEGIDLTNVTTETTYPAGGGSVNFNPKKLTLSNAVINTSDQYALNLGANVTEIVLEGINSVTNTFIAGGVGILASNDDGPLIIRGDSSDSLDVSARYGICAKALTFSGGNVTIEGSIYGLHAKGNVLVQNGAQVSVKSEAGFPIYVEGNSNELFDLTVDGNSKLTIEGYAPVDGNMAVSNGSIVTVAGSADIYGNLTVSGGSSLTLDEVCYIGGNLNVDANSTVNAMCETAIDDNIVDTIHGDYTIGQYGTFYIGSLSDPDPNYGHLNDDYKMNLSSNSVLTLKAPGNLTFLEDAVLADLTIGTGASITNNNYITLPEGTTVQQIQELPLSGTGVVRVATAYDAVGKPIAWDTYNHDGIKLIPIGEGDLGLDLTTGDHSGKTVESDGYRWDSVSNTLELGYAYIDGDITLPAGEVTINTTQATAIQGRLHSAIASAMNLTFTGTAPITFIGGINGGTYGDTVTLQNGAQVNVNGSIQLGSTGDGQLSGGVYVTDGSILTTNCSYGLYIIDGRLNVESGSKLIANSASAPFCMVDSSKSKALSDLVSLPGIPEGTGITNVTGTNASYWSLVPTGGSLEVSEESTPVVLTGAVKNPVTFQSDLKDAVINVSGTYTYNGAEHIPAADKVSVTIGGNTINGSNYEITASDNINAGTATITVTAKEDSNYTGTGTAQFTISKAAEPAITYPNASNLTYGQLLSESSLTGGSSSFGTFAWSNGNTVPTVANSVYSIYEVTFTPNANTIGNYEAISSTRDTVAVAVYRATPVVIVNSLITGRLATLTATVSGAANGEIPSGTVQFVDCTTGSDEDIAGATEVSIAGGVAAYEWTGLAYQIYKVKAVYSGNDNYNSTTSLLHEFDARKRSQLPITIDNIGTKQYGDGSFTLSATGGSGPGALTYTSSDTSIVSISGSTATIKKAGSVTITVTKAGDDTYNPVSSSVTLNIAKKELSAYSVNVLGTYTYDGNPQVPGPDNISVSSGGITISNSDYEVAVSNNTNVGMATVTVTAKEDSNYTGSATGQFTISKANTAVTVNSQIVGRRATLKAIVTGAANGEAPSGTVKFVDCSTGVDKDITGATAINISGGVATFEWTGLADQIYKVKAVYHGNNHYNTTTSPLHEFDARKLSQSPVTIGNIGTKQYGDDSFTLSATGGSGTGAFIYTSSDTSVVSISGSTATIKKAGSVTITVTKAEDDTYNPVSSSVSLNIAKKALSVKADDKLNIVRGSVMPVLSYTVSGLVNGDTFISPALNTTATSASTVGDYPITISGGNLSRPESYEITYTNGKLSIISKAENPSPPPEDGEQQPDDSKSNGTGTIPPEDGEQQPDDSKSNGTGTTAKADLKLDYTTSNGTASISLPPTKVNEIIEKSKAGEAMLDLSEISGTNAAELSKTAFTAFEDAGLDITVKLPLGAITIDNEAAGSIAGQVSDDNLKIEMKQIPTDSLTTTQKEAVRENDIVLDISIVSDGNNISSFDGKLTVKVPYTGPQPVAVWYLNDKGELEKLSCTFKDGVVSFDLNHLSMYVVGQDTEEADKEEPVIEDKATDWKNPYSDVKESDWFYDAVNYINRTGLMIGTSDTTFSPDMDTTRGMVVTILHRLEGMPMPKGANSFLDVGADKYYTDAVVWASGNKIVNGYGSGMFGPEDAITREQMAVILMNYARYKGYDVSMRADLSKFTDGESVSAWAKEAISWANAEGLIQGNKNQLMPSGNAQRSQVAAILQRFIETIVK